MDGRNSWIVRASIGGILLDNVYNHAFEDGEFVIVNVLVKRSAHDIISISVENNGCGFLKNGEGT